MVTVYGMNEKLGNISFFDSKAGDYAFNKPYSEATAKVIDDEVHDLVAGVYASTRQLLSDRRALLEVLAQELLKKEILFQSDLERLLGPRPYGKQTNLQAYMNGKTEGKGEKDVPQENEALPELNLPDAPESGRSAV
jgi:cell division protease FtsH